MANKQLPQLFWLPSLPTFTEDTQEIKNDARDFSFQPRPFMVPESAQYEYAAFPRQASPQPDRVQSLTSDSTFKSSRHIKWSLRLEWLLLRRVWLWLVGFAFIEYLHLVARNLVYYAQGKAYHYPHSDSTWRHHPPVDFPYPPIEDLGFMAFHAGDRLPTSLEWLTTFFVSSLAALMLLLWLARIFLNVRFGGPKIALTVQNTENRPVIILPTPLALIMRRMAIAGIIVIPLRCLTFLVTLLPPPNRHCQSAWSPPTTTQEIFNPFRSPRVGCGDQMFSGHTLHAVLITSMICHFFPYHRLLPVLAIANLTLVGISLVIFRYHYTADVLTAMYVTLGGWLLVPRDPSMLDKYGVHVHVRSRPPDYLTQGPEPYISAMQDLESGRESRVRDVQEEDSASDVEARGIDRLANVCGTCGARRRRGSNIYYLPPLPSARPALVEVEDRTGNVLAMGRLP